MGSKSYSKGICWIDDCRNGVEERQNQQKIFASGNGGVYEKSNSSKNEYISVKGRFPANILVSDDMLNDGNIVKSSNNWSKKTNLQSPYFTDERQEIQKDTSYEDKGTNSRYYDIDKWFDKILND